MYYDNTSSQNASNPKNRITSHPNKEENIVLYRKLGLTEEKFASKQCEHVGLDSRCFCLVFHTQEGIPILSKQICLASLKFNVSDLRNVLIQVQHYNFGCYEGMFVVIS